MKSSFNTWFLLLTGLSAVCGMCSKDDAGNNGSNTSGNNSNYTEPALNTADTWIYMTGNLSLYYPDNYTGNQVRPQNRKWIATSIVHSGAYVFKQTSGDTTKALLDFGFDNTDKFTRFCEDTLNPGGIERMEISLKNFSRTPGPGNYTMDVDYKQGFCWYEVYKSNGQLYDSTRYQAFNSSTLTIDKMVFVNSDASRDQYKMSGYASFWIMYFPTGANSITDIHQLQCNFNNVPVIFFK